MKDKEKNKKVCPERGQRVFVALSGGVDSAVAAALLKKQGHELIGVFMRLFENTRINTNKNPAPEQVRYGAGTNQHKLKEEESAKLIAKKLGIPFKVFDFRKEFKEKVIDYFLKGYKRGITPNPCVICNKEIKFGLFLEKALKMGADYVATGHYARLRREIRNPKSEILKLLVAKDKEKDQSYFLWTLTQEKLSKILFPIGDYTKKEVRNLAKKFGIADLIKKESEDICFLEGADLCGYLRMRINTDKGKILTIDGKILGEHEGLAFYTIGQRRGIKVAAKNPYYVIGKDIKNNALIVSQNPKDLLSKNLIAKDVNWMSGKEPKLPLKIRAKVRYRSEVAPAILVNCLRSKVYSLKFNELQRAITPGQSVVFYSSAGALAKADQKKELLGGGIINPVRSLRLLNKLEFYYPL